MKRQPLAWAAAAAVATFAVRASNAAITFDGSIGKARTLTGGNYAITTAQDGKVVGSNLFHSFSTFDVETNGSVTFFSPPGVTVRNVVARVTGGVAHIDGTVFTQTQGANLILIDPSGIAFGPNAKLSLDGGSFVASTASYVRFSDGGRFSSSLGGTSTLSGAAPAAFGFLSRSTASITVTGDPTQNAEGLTAPAGRSFSLIGGPIRIQQGRVVAPSGGTVNLVSTAAAGEVVLNPDQPTVLPDVSSVPQLGSIDVVQASSVQASNGGSVAIRGGTLNVNASDITAKNTDVSGGGIDLLVSGAVTLDHGRIAADTNGVANAGRLHLVADSLSATGLFGAAGAPISADTTSSGNGGDIFIDVGALSLFQNAYVSALTGIQPVASAAVVRAGAMTLQPAATGLNGDGGNITIHASRSILLDGTGSSSITGVAAETVANFLGGRAGDISIIAPSLTMLNSAEITSTTKGDGDAGNISVHACTITLDGKFNPNLTGLQARVGETPSSFTGARGSGGQIVVTADKSLTLIDGGVITATTFGAGTGGDVVVNTPKLAIRGARGVEFTGLFARSAREVAGQTIGGPGGSVIVNAGIVRASGNAGISAQSTDGGGRAGNVTINGRSVLLRHGASATVEAPNGQNGGSIVINAKRDIRVEHATVSAQSAGSGTITLNAAHEVVIRNGVITARATQQGGGRISIDPPIVVLDNSTIDGRSNGTPVPVVIDAQAVLLQSQSRILSAAISLPPEVDIAGSLVELPSPLISGAAQLQPQCGARFIGEDAFNSFIVTGRGGQPPEPGGAWPELDLSPLAR